MSYRLSVMVVPFASADLPRLVARLGTIARDISQRHPSVRTIDARISDPAWAARDEAWQILLTTPDGEAEQVPRSALLYAFDPTPMTLIVHDDRNGLSLFRHVSSDTPLWLGSDGPYVFGDLDRVTVEYPQRGYEHTELAALLGKREDALSMREARAVREPMNAVGIGLRQLYPSPLHYLDLPYTRTVWRVRDASSPDAEPREVDAPVRCELLVDARADDDVERRAPPPARLWMARAERETDPEARARAYFRAVELAPNDGAAAAGAGCALIALGENAGAIAMLSQAMRLAPHDTTPLYDRAAAFARAENRGAMLEDLRRSVVARSDDARRAAGDPRFARYASDGDFRATVRGGGRAAIDATLVRIERVVWSPPPAALRARRRSRIALLREHLRRSALWSAALACPERWPFFDVTARVRPDVPMPDEAQTMTVPSSLARIVVSTLAWTLRWSALPAPPRAELPDPYEPLLMLYERGGSLTMRGREIELDGAMVPARDRDAYAHGVPYCVLDPEALDRLDREPGG